MRKFIKEYYSITLFCCVMLFFVYVFSYATWSLLSGYGLSNHPELNKLMICLCVLAAIFYIVILVLGIVARFKREDD